VPNFNPFEISSPLASMENFELNKMQYFAYKEFRTFQPTKEDIELNVEIFKILFSQWLGYKMHQRLATYI
jgi:hypothetical protein